MARFTQLRIYHEASAQVRAVAKLSEGIRFGDLASQMRRAAVSVVSNICEGAGTRRDAEFLRFLRIARASNDEVAAQVLLARDLGAEFSADAFITANDRLGKMISALMARLASSG